MRTKTYIIPIQPIAWKRAGLNGSLFFDRQKAEKLATGLYLSQAHNNEEPFSGPLSMDVTFYLPAPRDKKSRTPGIYCYKTPDLDNLIKFLCDSCNDANIWEDDKLVCKITTQKIYDKNPRTVLILTELE